KLRSRKRSVLIYFIDTVRFRVLTLPSPSSIAEGLRCRSCVGDGVPCRRSRYLGIRVLAAFRWAVASQGLLPRARDSFVLILSRGGRFFLFRARLDAGSCFSARLSDFHGSNARCNGRYPGDRFEICVGRGRKRSFSPHRYAFPSRRPYLPIAEHHD